MWNSVIKSLEGKIMVVLNKNIILAIGTASLLFFGFTNSNVSAMETTNVPINEIKTETELQVEAELDNMSVNAVIEGEDADDYDINFETLPSEHNEYVDNEGNIVGNQEVEVLFEFDNDNKEEDKLISQIPTLDSLFNVPSVKAVTEGNSKKSGGIVAKVYVTYTRNSKGDVKLSRVYGSWTPTNKIFYVTNRLVTYGIHGSGKSGSIRPTGNAFSKYTGWGYAHAFLGQSNVISTATGRVSGMAGTHNIEVKVFF